MPNWLLNTQKALGQFHPEFIKGLISICISATMFISAFFSSNDALEYIPRMYQWILLGVMGLSTVVLNQLRDALSAYWKDKRVQEKIVSSTGDTAVFTNKNPL